MPLNITLIRFYLNYDNSGSYSVGSLSFTLNSCVDNNTYNLFIISLSTTDKSLFCCFFDFGLLKLSNYFIIETNNSLLFIILINVDSIGFID